MPSPKKRPPATRWSDGTTPLTDLSPNEQLAHAMVSSRLDLAPSVERIMSAELSDEQRTSALTAFRDSLGAVADPNRDPRVAIASAAKR